MTDSAPGTQEADESQGDLIWQLIHSNYPRTGGLSMESTDSANTTTDGESQRVPPLPDSLPANAVPVPYETHGLAGESSILGGSRTGAMPAGFLPLSFAPPMDPLGPAMSLTQPPGAQGLDLSQLSAPLSSAAAASSGPLVATTATTGSSKGSSKPHFKVPGAPSSASSFSTPKATVAPVQSAHASSSRVLTRSSAPNRAGTRAAVRLEPQDSFGQTTASQDARRALEEHGDTLIRLVEEASTGAEDSSRSMHSRHSRGQFQQASQESSQTQSSSSEDHSHDIAPDDLVGLSRSRGDILIAGTQSPAGSQSQHHPGGGNEGGGGGEESQGPEGQSSQVYYDDASLFDRIPSQASAPVEPAVHSSPYDVTSEQSQEAMEPTQIEDSVFAGHSASGTMGTVGTMGTMDSGETGFSTGTGMSSRQTNFLAQSNPNRHRRAVNVERFRNAVPYTFNPFMHSSIGDGSDDQREGTPPRMLSAMEPETQLVSPPRPRTRRQLPSASLRSTQRENSTNSGASTSVAPPQSGLLPPVPNPAPSSTSTATPARTQSPTKPRPPSPSTQHAGPSQPSQRSTFPNSSSSVIPGSVSSERSIHPHEFLLAAVQATQSPSRPGIGGGIVSDSQSFDSSAPKDEEQASSQPVPLALILGIAETKTATRTTRRQQAKGRQEESGDADAESSQNTPLAHVVAQRRTEKAAVASSSKDNDENDDDDNDVAKLDIDVGMFITQPLTAEQEQGLQRELDLEGSEHSSLGPKRQGAARKTYGRGRGTSKGSRGRAGGGGRAAKASTSAVRTEETTPKKASRQTKITDTIKSPGKKSPTKVVSPTRATTPPRGTLAAEISMVTTPGNDTTPVSVKRTFPAEEDLTSPSSGGVLSPEYMRRGRSPTVENVESPMEIEPEEVIPTQPSPSPRKTRRRLGTQPQVSVEAFSDASGPTRRTQRKASRTQVVPDDNESSSEDDNSGSYKDSQPIWLAKPSSSGIRLPRARMSREATAESTSSHSMPPPPAPRSTKRRRGSDSQSQVPSQRLTKRQRLDSASQAQERPRLPAVFAHYAADKHFYAAWVTGSLGGHGAKHKYAVVYADGSSAEVTLANLRPGPIVGAEVLVHRGKKWAKATMVAFDAEAATVRGTNGDEDDGIDDAVGWPTIRRSRAMVGDASLDEDDIRALIERHSLADDDVVAAPMSRGRVASVSSRSPAASMPLSRHVSSASASTRTQSDKLAAYAVLITSKNNDDWRQSLTDRLINAGAIIIHDWADVLAFGGGGEKEWSAVASDFQLLEDDGDDEDEAVPAPARRLLVLSNTDVQTPKYLIALALGVPCIHYSWALDVLRGSAETDDWSSYLLIAGTSDRIGAQGMSQFVRSPTGVRLQDLLQEPDADDTSVPRRRQPFANKRVLLIGDPIIPVRQENTVDGWDLGGSRCFPQVCLAMGAAAVDMVTGPGSIPRDRSFDIMIYGETRNNSGSYATELKRLKKRFGDCHVGSAHWLKQCLISGSIVTPTV